MVINKGDNVCSKRVTEICDTTNIFALKDSYAATKKPSTRLGGAPQTEKCDKRTLAAPRARANRNARDWALEDVMADGNRHFEHKYFTIRERIEKGEIIPYWISGKENPSDLLTKATDKGAVDALLPYIHGTKEIPIPEGLQVWFGPIECPELRGNPKQS